MSVEILRKLESSTNLYATKRDALREIASRCKTELDAIRDRYRAEIRAAASDAATAFTGLRDLIDQHRGLFNKPRSRLFSGIKVGLKKRPGRIEFDDAARVIELIRRKLPDKADALVRIKEEVARDALKLLQPAELAAIGAQLVDTGDEIVIDHPADEIDRLIEALSAEEDV